ncbi:MAG: trigger factor, partial [Planctomycetales bacterium]
TPDVLQGFGEFENEEKLREAVKDNLQRQLDYRQQQAVRQQILAALTETADWELPPELLERQVEREMERSMLELQRSGFDDREILAHETQLRQRSMTSTAHALKEHFVLERIAEEEGIEDVSEDYEHEIMLIAMQTGQNPRRVRSQMEKRNQMDVLRNQIIERKVIARIVEDAAFNDVPYVPEAEAATIDWAAGGEPDKADEPTESDESQDA